MEARIFEIEDKKLTINQDLNLGYAGSVWDSALVLAYFLLNKKSQKVINLQNKVILELGSGTGVIGLLCGILGARKIILTDKDNDTIKIIEKNFILNKNIFPKNLDCSIKKLDWFEKEDLLQIQENIDYIFGSDLVWNESLGNALYHVIDYYMSNNPNKNIECFLSLELRDKQILKFFEMFDKTKYKIEKLPENLYDDDYKDENILIIRIRKF